jgi:hypothetical protein
MSKELRQRRALRVAVHKMRPPKELFAYDYH